MDDGPDGLRRITDATGDRLVYARAGALHPLELSLAEALAAGRDGLHAEVDAALGREPLSGPTTLLAPVDAQEVWASGVTYRRSADAREEESVAADVYSLVYDAERPELFLKATPQRVPPPGAPLRIRADSGWDVPEPEVALVLDARGEIVGYLVADDVSSRSIEGANPLYLPQAKIYDDALGLSGTIVLARELSDEAVRAATITVSIVRSGTELFRGDTRVAEMKRSFADLVHALFAELSHPAGAVLLTGTGVVPPDEVTLLHGDEVSIEIDHIGALRHTIYSRESAA